MPRFRSRCSSYSVTRGHRRNTPAIPTGTDVPLLPRLRRNFCFRSLGSHARQRARTRGTRRPSTGFLSVPICQADDARPAVLAEHRVGVGDMVNVLRQLFFLHTAQQVTTAPCAAQGDGNGDIQVNWGELQFLVPDPNTSFPAVRLSSKSGTPGVGVLINPSPRTAILCARSPQGARRICPRGWYKRLCFGSEMWKRAPVSKFQCIALGRLPAQFQHAASCCFLWLSPQSVNRERNPASRDTLLNEQSRR